MWYPEDHGFAQLHASRILECASLGDKAVLQGIVPNGKQPSMPGLYYLQSETVARWDAIHENDGPRIIRYWKEDLIQLNTHKHPKYLRLVGDIFLLQVAGSASHRIRHSLVGDRTTNTVLGSGNNILQDKQQQQQQKYTTPIKLLPQAEGNTAQAVVFRIWANSRENQFCPKRKEGWRRNDQHTGSKG